MGAACGGGEREPCRNLWLPGVASRRRQARRSRGRAGDNAAERRHCRCSDTMMVDVYPAGVRPGWCGLTHTTGRGHCTAEIILTGAGQFLPFFLHQGEAGGDSRRYAGRAERSPEARGRPDGEVPKDQKRGNENRWRYSKPMWVVIQSAGHRIALVRFLSLTRFGRPGLFQSMSAMTIPLSSLCKALTLPWADCMSLGYRLCRSMKVWL